MNHAAMTVLAALLVTTLLPGAIHGAGAAMNQTVPAPTAIVEVQQPAHHGHTLDATRSQSTLRASDSPVQAGVGEATSTAPGHHIVAHAFVEDRNGPDRTVVAAAVDAQGDLVMYAWVQFAWLYVSDGFDQGGQVSEARVGRFWLADWSRLDLLFEGATYTLMVDQVHAFTGATLAPATEAALLEDPADAFPWADAAAATTRTRSDPGDGSGEQTFSTAPGPDDPWQITATAGSVEVEPDTTGHDGRGHAAIFPDPSEAGVAYLAADLSPFGTRYGLEASVRIGTLLPPSGDALLAGIRGPADTPAVDWAIVMDLAPREDLLFLDPTQDNRALYFQAPDGSTTHLVTWRGVGWHWIRLTLDAAAGSVAVHFDGAPAATFSGLDLAASTAVATGDLDTDVPDLSEGGARFDDLAIYPLAEGGT